MAETIYGAISTINWRATEGLPLGVPPLWAYGIEVTCRGVQGGAGLDLLNLGDYWTSSCKSLALVSHKPCGRENINAIQAFSTIHLSQHLVHHTIRNPRTIVPS